MKMDTKYKIILHLLLFGFEILFAIGLFFFIKQSASDYLSNKLCIEAAQKDEYLQEHVQELGFDIIQDEGDVYFVLNDKRFKVEYTEFGAECLEHYYVIDPAFEDEVAKILLNNHATDLGQSLSRIQFSVEEALIVERLLVSYRYDDRSFKEKSSELAFRINRVISNAPMELDSSNPYELKFEVYREMLQKRRDLIDNNSIQAFELNPYFYENFAIPIFEDMITNQTDIKHTLPYITVGVDTIRSWDHFKVKGTSDYHWFNYMYDFEKFLDNQEF